MNYKEKEEAMKSSGEDCNRNAKSGVVSFSKENKENRVVPFDKYLKATNKSAKENTSINMYLNHADRLGW